MPHQCPGVNRHFGLDSKIGKGPTLSRETPHPVGRQSGCSQCTLQRSQWRKSTANAIKANHGSLDFYGILVLSRLGEVEVEPSRWAQQMGSQTTLENQMPPRKVVMARRGTHERKRDRQALGTLQSLVVHATTEKRYFEAVSRFLEFLQMHAYSYPSSFAALDSRVSEFIEYLWHSGEPKAFASDCLSGLGHFVPQVKRFMVGSWRLHGSWSRAELPCRALPFTPLVLYAIAQRAFEMGFRDICILLLLGFDRFARTGELFAAVKQDFTFNKPLTKVVWTLPLSKSGHRTGAQESLVVEDPWLVKALHSFLKQLEPGDTLRSVSAGLMRTRLKEVMLSLSLQSGYQWYSCHRGGATWSYRQSNNLAHVCFVGRWNCHKTARIYITDALAQLTEIDLSLEQHRRLLSFARKARPSFSFE